MAWRALYGLACAVWLGVRCMAWIAWVLHKAPVSSATVMVWIIGAVHLLSAFGLIGLVLLHSGRGGGVSDMFGGTVGSTAAGSTVAEKNLSRITVVVAVSFGFTTLILGLLLA